VLASNGKKKYYVMNWKNFRKLFIGKYVPHHEVEKLENEYLHLQIVGTEHINYTVGFLEIVGLIPDFMETESKRIGRYIFGLVPIRGRLLGGRD
jgi:hypothetical protein